MSSSDNTDSSVAQTVLAGHKVQGHVERLKGCFDIDSIPEEAGWSKVEWGMYDGSKILDEIKAEFKKEFGRSRKTTDIVDALATPPTKPYLVSRSVQLLVFQSGWSNLGDNCTALIPVAMSGTIEAIIKEQTSQRQTTLTFTPNSEVMITGRSLIWIPDNSKVVCIMLGIGIAKDK